MAQYFPPNYYANGQQPQIQIKEDKALRRRGKQILDAFNAKR